MAIAPRRTAGSTPSAHFASLATRELPEAALPIHVTAAELPFGLAFPLETKESVSAVVHSWVERRVVSRVLIRGPGNELAAVVNWSALPAIFISDYVPRDDETEEHVTVDVFLDESGDPSMYTQQIAR